MTDLKQKTDAELISERTTCFAHREQIQGQIDRISLELHERKYKVRKGDVLTINGNRFIVDSFDDDYPWLKMEKNSQWETHARPARFWAEWKKGQAKTPMRR